MSLIISRSIPNAMGALLSGRHTRHQPSHFLDVASKAVVLLLSTRPKEAG